MRSFYYQILFLLGIYVLFSLSLYGQYYDNHWVLGYSTLSEPNNGFGLVQLDFTNNQLMVGEELDITIPIQLGRNISLTSTFTGDSILFYYNGLQVNNGAHELAINGEDMFYGDISLGYNIPQGSIVLPVPDQTDEYKLISTYVTQDTESFEVYGPELTISTISTASSPQVTVKNEVVVSGRLSIGQLTATRHANGRDWWIVWPYKSSNQYLRLLLTPEGLERREDQFLPQPIHSGVGRAVFSPDGTVFAMFHGVGAEFGDFFDLYDFDRCTGLLSNHRHYNLASSGSAGGVAVSHDSRFLYISSTNYLFQLDLWEADPFAGLDTVAVYDGVQAPFFTAFNEPQLARDGKIYLSGTGSMQNLHVMDYPNRPGAACSVRQRGIQLPVRNSFGVPNFPFHRLGPLDGSPCDTLGIDNVPLADFRSDQNADDYLDFFFQNLSTYEPTEWSWSFGDGVVSQDTSPVHTYAQDGIYEVCLTVSNAYGSDTTCDSLRLGVVNSAEATVAGVLGYQLFPNPARDHFTVNLVDYYPREAYLEMYDGLGRRVRYARLYAGWNTIGIQDLPPGVYHYVLRDGDVRLGDGKVVKVE